MLRELARGTVQVVILPVRAPVPRLELEVERAIDRALAGQLTDAIAWSLARRARRPPRRGDRVVARATPVELDVQVIPDRRRRRDGVEHQRENRSQRLLIRVLESTLLDNLVEHLLESPEFQLILERVASSPEVLAAVTHHTETLTEEMVDDVRSRSRKVDDLAERTVRGGLRRPRPTGPAPSTP